MKEEQVILVDTNDNPIGLSPKMEAHEKALLHRAFSVFIFNDEGKLLLQQRAAHKYHSPELWTNTVCSHQRQGETNIQAGKRRLQEEMGLNTGLKEVFSFIYKAEFDNGLTEHELDHVLVGFSNENPKINPDEVMNFSWESLENIEADIKSNPQRYTEWFKIIFKNSLPKLRAELDKKMLQKPIEFQEQFFEKPWGGKKLKTILNKKIPSDKTGESWEISDVKNHISVVKDGYFKGKTLSELLEKYQALLVGEKVYKKFKTDFPLLIKFIDAADDLSIQVHPDDEMAEKYHQSFGKNELWHIVQADPGALLYIGFKENIDKNDYLKSLNEGNLEKILNKIEVKSGDTVYIPAGTVHAIGKGILLAEIQQTSDLTYRIYDWNRVGLDGKPRELHTEKALEAIDFQAKPDFRNENPIKTPFFNIEKLSIKNDKKIQLTKDSFSILMNVGKGEFLVNDIKFKQGQTLFIPAVTEQLEISCKNAGEVLLINI